MIDIESRLAAAANASEDTNEGSVGEEKLENVKKVVAETNEKIQAVKDLKPEIVKSEETQPEFSFESKPEPKPEPQYEPEPKYEPKPEPKYEAKPEPKPEPVVSRPAVGLVGNKSNVSVEDIGKILTMREILDSYEEKERQFVVDYFESTKGNIADVIYKALIANKSELRALSNIAIAKRHSAADRAFYLMDLKDREIETIYEQIDLLTGQLGDSGEVNSSNKIKMCRTLEKAISEMDDNVFTYIDKLQNFTDKAVS